MKRLCLSLAVLAASAGLAHAADLLEDSVPVVVDEAMFDWTGFYVGVQGGLTMGTVRLDDNYCVQTNDCGFPGSRYYSEPDLSGYEIGGHIGAAQQIDSIVLGVETDLNWADVSGEGGFHYYDAEIDEVFDGNPDEWTSFTLNWEGSARAKIGIAVDRFLPYVTAGLAYGQADIYAHREFGPEEEQRELDFDHSVNLIGYTVGLGAAYAMTDNMIVRAEARYTEYGEVLTHANTADMNDGEDLLVTGPQLLSIQGGVSFKF